MSAPIITEVPESTEVSTHQDDNEVVHILCPDCYPDPVNQFDYIVSVCGKVGDPTELVEPGIGNCSKCIEQFRSHGEDRCR